MHGPGDEVLRQVSVRLGDLEVHRSRAAELAAKIRPAIDSYETAYEDAVQRLTLAESISDVNDILSIAAAMETHARTFSDRGLELDAIELRFHAECRLDDITADKNQASGDLRR